MDRHSHFYGHVHGTHKVGLCDCGIRRWRSCLCGSECVACNSVASRRGSAWGLAPRSSGAQTALHQARSGGTRYIFASPGLACRRRPLGSNVDRINSTLRHSTANEYGLRLRRSTGAGAGSLEEWPACGRSAPSQGSRNRPTKAVIDGCAIQMSTSGRSKPNPTRQV